MGSSKGFLHRKMNLYSGYFWVFLSNLMQTLFGVFHRIFSRYYSPSAIDSSLFSNPSQENYQTESNFTKLKTDVNFSDPKAEEIAICSKSSEDTEFISESFEAGFNSISSYESNQIDSNGSGQEAELKQDCSETVDDTENVGLEAGFNSIFSYESNQIHSNGSGQEAELKQDCSETVDDAENVGLGEEESPKLVFKFQYQTWKYSEELDESYEFDNRDRASASTNKYEFMSGKSFSQFLEEPEVSNFTVKELYFLSNEDSLESKEISDSGFLSEKDFMPEDREGGTVHVETHDNSTEKVDKEVVAETFMAVPSPEPTDSGKEQLENPNSNMLGEEISVGDDFLSEDDFILSSESHSINSNLDSLFEAQLTGDRFLSETDFRTSIELDTLTNNDEEIAGLTEEDLYMEEQKNSETLDVGYEPDDFDEEDRYIMEELRRLEEESQLQKSDVADMENRKGNNFHGSIDSKPEEFGKRDKTPIDCSDESAKPNLQISTASDPDDSNRFDTLWEHQDLIEQLKMELKKVRATGLPTIFEDSESPRIMEDLKPWKIDEKFHHGSGINELPKFYRSYRERMRKFDILNFQKMYAIGVLQSKDPLQSFSSHSTSAPAITSLLSHRFRLCRRKKSKVDPMKKFIRELYSDLEMVYVGQLCLSWEFLQWEYEKALELWESDQYGSRSYNEVAGEFQQFQVLLQRFIENEPFQGPRVENYVRNRCLMRNLLQVPVIREDNAKDKKKLRKRGTDNDVITSDMVVEILEESIRTIWRFIRADKDASSLTPKDLTEAQVELQNPADSELLLEVRAELQKKEKRLRDVLRSGSCILKKFQKHQEDETDQFLYFFSQVDMKLVWRVLNMSRITTDQLAWCRNKLNKISFVNRRIHVEPSFLLFPC